MCVGMHTHVDNLINHSYLVHACVCVLWYLQHQEKKRRERNHRDDVEMKDENVPPLKRLYSIGTPAYRAKAKRQQEQPKSVRDRSYDLTTDIENDFSTSECATTIGYEKLTRDLDRLQQERGWLNDRLINAGQILLQKKHFLMKNIDLARILSFIQSEPSFVWEVIHAKIPRTFCGGGGGGGVGGGRGWEIEN